MNLEGKTALWSFFLRFQLFVFFYRVRASFFIRFQLYPIRFFFVFRFRFFFFVFSFVQFGCFCVLDRPWSTWTCLPIVVGLPIVVVFFSFSHRFLIVFYAGSCLAAKPKPQWTLVQAGLVITQDPTQKFHIFHATSVLDPV